MIQITTPTTMPHTEAMSNLTDTTLLSHIQNQCADAMEVFYKRHANALYAFAYRRMNDAALADEVTNDTMLQVWRSAAAFAGQSTVKTWVLGICKNKSLDALRSRGRLDAREVETSDDNKATFSDTSPSAYTQMLAKQQGHHLAECLSKLPPEQRDCMHLWLVQGMTLAEIAQVMAVPANTVASRIHHAKRKLRDCLECIFGQGDVL